MHYLSHSVSHTWTLQCLDYIRTAVSAKYELPPILTARLSPLTTLQTATYLDYIKRGSISAHTDEFCKAGHLFCGGSPDKHAAKWLSNKPDPEDYANIEEVIFTQWVEDECVDDLPDQRRAAAFLNETVALWQPNILSKHQIMLKKRKLSPISENQTLL